MFEIKLSKKAERFLSKCDKLLFERIKTKLKILESNPVPKDSKKNQR